MKESLLGSRWLLAEAALELAYQVSLLINCHPNGPGSLNWKMLCERTVIRDFTDLYGQRKNVNKCDNFSDHAPL